MNILIIAAHPDDEVLGCGGTIAELSKDNKVNVLILGEGITSRGKTFDSRSELESLRGISKWANRLLGVHEVMHQNFPDQMLDTIPFLDVVKEIELYMKLDYNFDPDIIFTHSVNDLNLDHTIVARAVLTATRPMAEKKLRAVYSFEIPSSTEWSFGQNEPFQPNVFFDISQTIDKKIEAMKIYSGEIRLSPHPRSEESIRALATYRGSTIGVPAAEVFKLIWARGLA